MKKLSDLKKGGEMAHTVSLEIDEQLHEAGWPGEAYPTLGELIRELPDDYYIKKITDNHYIIMDSHPFDANLDEKIIHADTPEDAAALAWIELQKANTKK